VFLLPFFVPLVFSESAGNGFFEIVNAGFSEGDFKAVGILSGGLDEY